MSQYTWPPVSFSGNSNPSVGVNGAAIPTSSTLVGGSDGTDLRPLLTETDGTLNVVAHGTSAITGHVIVDSGTISRLSSGTISSSVLPTGAATETTLSAVSTKLTDNTQKSQIVNSSGSAVTVKDLSVQVASGDFGLVTNTVIHGLNSGGGGSYVDVKVNPSGALTVDATQSGTWNVGTVSLLSSGTVTLSGTPGVSIVNGTVAISGTHAVTVSSGTVTINGTPSVGAIATTPAAGTVSQAALTVGTAATLLVASGTVVTAGRIALVVTPDASSSAKFYVGSSSVTPTSTTRGIQLVGGQPLVINNDASPYYICSDTASQTVYVMETKP